MKVTVVGLGHVGIVAATGFARSGHEVLAIDVDPFKVQALDAGECGRFEPGLMDRLKGTLKADSIKFMHCDEVDETLGGVALIAVGIPARDGYAPDLSQVRAAIRWVKERSDGNLVMAMKSTVPPGTGHAVLQDELLGTGIGYAANPEFLRAGQALADWDCPDRIVIGTEPGDTRSLEVMRSLYSNIDARVLATDITTAEMVKYASNALLATRISLINEIAAICDRVGASIEDVSEGLALDSGSGARIFAGVGYGVPCLPKDIGALEHQASQSGAGSDLLRAVIGVNDRQWQLPRRALRARFGGNLQGLRIAILGLSFKPGTGDLTEAPAVKLARSLFEEGAKLTAYDPSVRDDKSAPIHGVVRVATDVLTATTGSQAAVVMTEWGEMVEADWALVSRNMASPKFIFDGRNALDQVIIRAAGFEYAGVGRVSAPKVSLGC